MGAIMIPAIIICLISASLAGIINIGKITTDKTPNRIPEIRENIEKLKNKFNLQPDEFAIIINPERQELYLIKNEQIIKVYVISTGKTGIGSKMGSGKTPAGTHRIVEKIGAGAPIGTSFKGRKETGFIREIFTKETKLPRDSMTTRIIWLDGQEEGLNRGGNVDSYRRYIYIHGTRKEWLLGKPFSLGCIKMKNTDIIELFDTVPLNTLVEIQNKN